MPPRLAVTAAAVPGLLLGIGVGGFVDGIVFHQILEWHHMLSSTARWPLATAHGRRANILADGIFHAVMLAIVSAGVIALSRRGGRARTGEVVAWTAVGWALFNLVEGIVDHQVLGIHHVREGDGELAADVGFLVGSVVLGLAGLVAVGRRGHVD